LRGARRLPGREEEAGKGGDCWEGDAMDNNSIGSSAEQELLL